MNVKTNSAVVPNGNHPAQTQKSIKKQACAAHLVIHQAQKEKLKSPTNAVKFHLAKNMCPLPIKA